MKPGENGLEIRLPVYIGHFIYFKTCRRQETCISTCAHRCLHKANSNLKMYFFPLTVHFAWRGDLTLWGSSFPLLYIVYGFLLHWVIINIKHVSHVQSSHSSMQNVGRWYQTRTLSPFPLPGSSIWLDFNLAISIFLTN